MAYEQFRSVIYKFWFFQPECSFPKSWHCVIVFYCTSLRMYHSAGYKANTEYILLMDSFQLFAMLITLKDFPAIFLKTHPLWELHLFSIFPYRLSHLNMSNMPPGFCAFYHTTNALSGRSWDHGCCLSSIPKGCVVQSIASCCFPYPLCITAWKVLLLWVIQKGEICWIFFFTLAYFMGGIHLK